MFLFKQFFNTVFKKIVKIIIVKLEILITMIKVSLKKIINRIRFIIKDLIGASLPLPRYTYAYAHLVM